MKSWGFTLIFALISFCACTSFAQTFSSDIENIIQKMSLEEKVQLLGGASDGFSVPGNEKYGIPSLVMTDGAVGVVRIHPGTAFPAGIALAASFDPRLAYQMAHAIGQEARANGENVLLAPNVNIARIPLGGRVYEGYGEDPYLSGQIAAQFVRGAQDANVMTTVKHFVLNDQEYQRDTTDVQIDEKTFQEIYLQPFKAAIDAGAAAVMGSYNKIRGEYACENSYLLNEVLKKQMNFSGFVVSDWGATHSTLLSALAGLDMEMPVLDYFGNPLIAAQANKQISMDLINDKVRRILTAMQKVGLLGQAPVAPKVDLQSNADLARSIAAQSLVLLKNQNHLLPLNPNKKMQVAFIGPSAKVARTGGGGSSHVPSPNALSPLEAISAQLLQMQSPVQIEFAQGTFLAADPQPTNLELFRTLDESGLLTSGLRGDYFANSDLAGAPAFSRIDKNLNFNWDWTSPNPSLNSGNFSVRWSAEFVPQHTGDHEFDFSFDDGMRLYIDDQLVVDQWQNPSVQGGLRTAKYQAHFIAQHAYKIRMEYTQKANLATFTASVREPQNGILPDLTQEATDLAKKSDVVVLFVGLSNKLESESFDRSDFSLPLDQVDLIQKVSQANPNTIVVVEAGSPVDLSWQNSVASLIYAWYPGVEGAQAIGDVLFGKVNPSGKLPITMPTSLADVPSMLYYPGDAHFNEKYGEGSHIGYRGIKNAYYTFGYGLSYSDFLIDHLSIIQNAKNIKVSFDLHNLSNIDGAEVLELYTQDPRTQDYWNLKSFKKVTTSKKSTQTVSFELPIWSTFQEFDTKTNTWGLTPGTYKLQVRAGSLSKPLATQVTIKSNQGTL